jgi:DNA-binding SARP family transcriptional activator
MAERDVIPATLHIGLLGDFRLACGESPVTSVNTPRLQALLAYLILHRHAPQARRHLAFLFWPDSTEAQARTNLRHLLHELQHALPDGEHHLLAGTQTVQWLPHGPCALDVAGFEEAIAAGDRESLQRAVDLYRGDLLPSCYDDWILPERERLSQAHAAALERLIGLAEDQRDYRAAVAYAGRLLQHVPGHEAAYRSLMRLHALNGDRAAALHVYHTCVTVLQRELGVAPDASTCALHEQLLNAETSAAGPAAGAPAALAAATSFPLVGRGHEWVQLQAVWRDASAGRPQLALIAGEAGIGKTRLAEELEAWAGHQGILTASARCYAAEGALPYAPVAAWLRARPLPPLEPVWRTELARLLPELMAARPTLTPPEPLREAWQRNRLFEALARGVLCCRRPRLLVLDDLQWCDPDTLAWLHYLLRFDPCRGLLVVGTLRTGEIRAPELDALLAALRRDGLVTEVELGPLDARETATLAGLVAGRPLDPGMAEPLFRGSEGNPLFVVEMMQAGMAMAHIEESDRVARPADHPHALTAAPQPLPRKVQQVLERRLAQLSPAARELAELAATIGRQVNFDVLRAAADLTDDALVHGLDELWQRRILREQGNDAYDFSHDKIREAAYAGLSIARRRLLHRRVAQALALLHTADLDAVSGQIGRHYELAGLTEPAVTHYRRAAEAAQQVYANSDAIQHYRQALVLLGDPLPNNQATAALLWERLGDILQLTGQFEPARAAYRQGLDRSPVLDPMGRAGLLRKLGSAWRDPGRYEQARQAYDEALGILDQPSAEAAGGRWHEWIELQVDRIHLQYWQNQVQEAAELLKTLRPLVEQHGTAYQRARFFIWSALILLRRDRFRPSATTAADLRQALAATQESASAADVPLITFQLGFLLLWHDELNAAGERLETALRLAERSGDIALQARCLTYLTLIARRSGREEEVACRAAQSLEVGTAAHMPEFGAAALANQAWLAWRHGRLDDVETDSQAALELWAGLAFAYGFEWLALWPLIAAALRRDQLAQAADAARRLLHPTQQRLPDDLTAALQAAGEAMAAGLTAQVRAHLVSAVTLAQAAGQL